MSVWISLTIFRTASAAGGGGGGGGGGAISMVSNCPLGSSSVNIRGTSNIMQMARQFTINEVVVATALRLLWAPKSSTLSANMGFGGSGGPRTISARGT